MTVLIIAHLFEPSVNAVIRELEKRDVPWARLNCEEFPLFAHGNVFLSGQEAYGLIETEAGVIDTRAIRSVWFRRTAKPAVPKFMSTKDKDFTRSECNAFLNGAFDLIYGRWINPREAERSASKILQLVTAAQCGLRIPKTLISNSPDAARAFYANSEARVAFKPVSGYAPRGADFSKHMAERFGDQIDFEIEDASDRSDTAEIVFNQILTAEKMEQIDSLKLCPATFQEYVEKSADIRVTIVGDNIFACRILSQNSKETQIDFRRMVLLDSIKEIVHERIILPIQIQEKLHSFMQQMGLHFGCIDLLETDEGEYVFLEVNPSGQWMWIETIVGYPISEILGAELSKPPS